MIMFTFIQWVKLFHLSECKNGIISSLECWIEFISETMWIWSFPCRKYSIMNSISLTEIQISTFFFFLLSHFEKLCFPETCPYVLLDLILLLYTSYIFRSGSSISSSSWYMCRVLLVVLSRSLSVLLTFQRASLGSQAFYYFLALFYCFVLIMPFLLINLVYSFFLKWKKFLGMIDFKLSFGKFTYHDDSFPLNSTLLSCDQQIFHILCFHLCSTFNFLFFHHRPPWPNCKVKKHKENHTKAHHKLCY